MYNFALLTLLQVSKRRYIQTKRATDEDLRYTLQRSMKPIELHAWPEVAPMLGSQIWRMRTILKAENNIGNFNASVQNQNFLQDTGELSVDVQECMAKEKTPFG